MTTNAGEYCCEVGEAVAKRAEEAEAKCEALQKRVDAAGWQDQAVITLVEENEQLKDNRSDMRGTVTALTDYKNLFLGVQLMLSDEVDRLTAEDPDFNGLELVDVSTALVGRFRTLTAENERLKNQLMVRESRVRAEMIQKVRDAFPTNWPSPPPEEFSQLSKDIIGAVGLSQIIELLKQRVLTALEADSKGEAK